MESATKACIINVGLAGWYGTGSKRLQRSLIFNGFAHDILIWADSAPPNSEDHNLNPYNFKIHAFKEALRRGYRVVLWLDSSFWCIKTPYPIFDIIVSEGIYAFRTGYNCAQSCADKVLEWADVTRDEAEKIPEIATGAVGINFDNPHGNDVWTKWLEGFNLGLFKTNRSHDPADSLDPRFLHARQDQSVYSMACHLSGVKPEGRDLIAYYSTNFDTDKCCFFIGGM